MVFAGELHSYEGLRATVPWPWTVFLLPPFTAITNAVNVQYSLTLMVRLMVLKNLQNVYIKGTDRWWIRVTGT
jgi:hypothetical protein